MVKDKLLKGQNGYLHLTIYLLFSLGFIWGIYLGVREASPLWTLSAIGGLATSLFLMGGLFIVNPNEARVLQLFGDYVGTITRPGLLWANPFYTKRKVSLRVRNFETGKVKVNDLTGNPVEIAAVVVWQVVDGAEALFEVDNFEDYVRVQSEAAVRNLATNYPYDAHDDVSLSLSHNTAEVSTRLQEELQERLDKAGVNVKEARISHLAYAQEIAAAMLQRQQAAAVVAARTQIVEGAVGMVEMALDRLGKKQIVDLDEERKAAMVSNLLVVLCSDRHTQPVVNTGTLHN
jgi:regulator of protease activity HflC (stomatin/prohibitin superfamily)